MLFDAWCLPSAARCFRRVSLERLPSLSIEKAPPPALCRPLPEIRALHLRVAEQAFARSGEHDAAALHHVGVVGDLQGLAGVLLDQQDGLTLVLELAQGAENPRHQPGSKP